MVMTQRDLFDKEQTAKEMYRLISRYNGDLENSFVIKRGGRVPLSGLPVKDFYDVVRRMPYRKDLTNIEVVLRPRHILRVGPLMGADCKKKAILMGSYFKNNGIPYRLIGSSSKRSKRIHHVFPQFFMDDIWINADGTYSHYKLGEKKSVTKAVVL